MTLKEIKKAVNAALKKSYPDYKIYGADTIEGYEKPCFFTYTNLTFSESTKNMAHKNVEVTIDYIQRSPDESDGMDFFTKMEHLFCLKLDTGDRKLSTSNQQSDFVGDNANIPSFSFDVEFWDAIEKETDNTPLMGELIMKEVTEGDYQ